MIVTSMQLTISSRRDIAVLEKESSALESEEDVKKLMSAFQNTDRNSGSHLLKARTARLCARWVQRLGR